MSSTNEALIGSVLAFTLIVGTIVAINYQDKSRAKEQAVVKEFVCYDDGKLVERHVGVQTAITNENAVWSIRYVEGTETSYKQDNGESCMVEVIR